MDFIDEIKSINKQINELTSRKSQIVVDHYNEILDKVLNMMDWDKKDVKESSIQYSSFEKKIMIEVFLHKEPNVRYVFSLNGRREIVLHFRQDFSKD